MTGEVVSLDFWRRAQLFDCNARDSEGVGVVPEALPLTLIDHAYQCVFQEKSFELGYAQEAYRRACLAFLCGKSSDTESTKVNSRQGADIYRHDIVEIPREARPMMCSILKGLKSCSPSYP